MAGFIFSYSPGEGVKDSEVPARIEELFNAKEFGTVNNTSKLGYTILCDYLSMKEGDNIYFFCKRKIYGIGELINFENLNDCKAWVSEDAKNRFVEMCEDKKGRDGHTDNQEGKSDRNDVSENVKDNTVDDLQQESVNSVILHNAVSDYGANQPKEGTSSKENKDNAERDNSKKPDNSKKSGDNIHIKFRFGYDRLFYNINNEKQTTSDGNSIDSSKDRILKPVAADMDDVLRFRPSSFRTIRFFDKKSFIKIDDDENQTLKEFFYLDRYLKKNTQIIGIEHTENKEANNTDGDKSSSSPNDEKRELVLISPEDIHKVNKKNELSEEMILEAYILDSLLKNDESLVSKLGTWDFVSHQVIASPYKPAEYADKIDVFAIRYLQNKGLNHVPCGFLIVELKQGMVSRYAQKEKYPLKEGELEGTIYQLMKYVDWVCTEYAHGDYRLIKAAIIAPRYKLNKSKKTKDKDIVDVLQGAVTRHTLVETHPFKYEPWHNLSLISYKFDDKKNIKYEEIVNFNRRRQESSDKPNQEHF